MRNNILQDRLCINYYSEGTVATCRNSTSAFLFGYYSYTRVYTILDSTIAFVLRNRDRHYHLPTEVNI